MRPRVFCLKLGCLDSSSAILEWHVLTCHGSPRTDCPPHPTNLMRSSFAARGVVRNVSIGSWFRCAPRDVGLHPKVRCYPIFPGPSLPQNVFYVVTIVCHSTLLGNVGTNKQTSVCALSNQTNKPHVHRYCNNTHIHIHSCARAHTHKLGCVQTVPVETVSCVDQLAGFFKIVFFLLIFLQARGTSCALKQTNSRTHVHF